MCPKKKEKLDKDFYYKDNAKFYSDSQWMAKNQTTTTTRALELLEDIKIGGKLDKTPSLPIVLDLGCGNGFSSYVCEKKGFKVVGLDLSMDMLYENIQHQKIMENDIENRVHKRILINASIEHIPLRDESVNFIISISAFNFVINESITVMEKKNLLFGISRDLKRILRQNGRIVIEFYPKQKDLDLYLKTLKNDFNGGLIIDNPSLRKEKKFLILKSIK